jgi:hypothetical protein
MTRRGRTSRLGWVVPAALALLGLIAIGCAAPTTPRTTFPPFGSTPAPPGDATAATRQQVVQALASVGLQAVDSTRPYRPPEGPLLAAAPRTVLQALPDDALHGNVVIYALGSDVAAQKAAADHAAYIASNIGRIQFAQDSRFVLRQVGSTVVFFTRSPGGSPDPRLQSIQDALSTLGTEVTIPS